MNIYLFWAFLLFVVFSQCNASSDFSPFFHSPPGARPNLLGKSNEKMKANLNKDFQDTAAYSTLDHTFSFKDYISSGKRAFLRDLKNGVFKKNNVTSQQCLSSMRKWFEEGALRMWDSWAVPESGILEGNVKYTGHYHECKLYENKDFSGKYCLAYYGVFFIPSTPGIPIDLTAGTCFPSTCSDQAISDLYSTYFKIKDFPPFLAMSCTHYPYWRPIDTICVVICAVLAACCVAGTITDCVIRQKNKVDMKMGRDSEKQAKSKSHSFGIKILLCFSVVSNGEKIIDMKKHPGMLPALDGIRFISTTWVILGHTLQAMFYGIDNAVFARRQILDNASSMAILNALFSVDTFFFLSGLLVAYLGLKHMAKQNGFLNVPLMYLQRYLRLTPLYAFLILFTSSVYKYLGSGPGYNYISNSYYDSCKDNWWTNLVYINNLYPVSNSCYAVAWYLANDWQFFLFAPLFIFLLYKFRIVGILASLSVILGSTIVNGVLSSVYNIQPSVIGLVQSLSYFYRYFLVSFLVNYEDYGYDDKFQTDTYNTPWARVHVYMIGMLTGYALYACKGKIKMNKAVAIIGWIVAAAGALAILYSPWIYVKDMEEFPTNTAALYNALSRPAWGLCLAWVAIACCSGYGGFITTFLDWKVFKPLSRLTYSVYLCHIYVLYWYGFNHESPLHYLTVELVYMFLGTTVLTFGIGFVVSVCVEWPFVGICKLLFNPNNNRSTSNNRNEVITSSASTSDDTVSYFSSSNPDTKWEYSTPTSQSGETTKQIGLENKGFDENEKAIDPEAITEL